MEQGGVGHAGSFIRRDVRMDKCNRCHICPQHEDNARESLIKRLLTRPGCQEDLFEEYAETMVFGNAYADS